MKKFIAFLLIIVLSLSVFSCGTKRLEDKLVDKYWVCGDSSLKFYSDGSCLVNGVALGWEITENKTLILTKSGSILSSGGVITYEWKSGWRVDSNSLEIIDSDGTVSEYTPIE